MATHRPTWVSLVTILLITSQFNQLTSGQTPGRRNPGVRNKYNGKNGPIVKDAFLEDNSFIVRIRTTYNPQNVTTCNGVVMEEQLIMSDVSCIKYGAGNMANIDAKFVQVITGDPHDRETIYEVEQIYVNKADPKDPGSELAVLKLAKPLIADSPCRNLIKPERNHSMELETQVRVIGFTQDGELKENRSRVSKKLSMNQSNKFICTTPADLNETPGKFLLKGAPLLFMVDCRQYQIVGIWSSTITTNESQALLRKQQDCYVMVSSQMKWFDQVKSLATLAAKKDDDSRAQPSIIMVTVTDDNQVVSTPYPNITLSSATL